MIGLSLPTHLTQEIPRRFGARGSEWLTTLPAVVSDLASRWDLTIGDAYPDSNVSLAIRADSSDFGPCVLKVPSSPEDGRAAAVALSAWGGEGAARLHRLDETTGAALVERCEPGRTLDTCDNFAALDAIAASLLRRIWRAPAAGSRFMSLNEHTIERQRRAERTYERAGRPIDADLMTLVLDWSTDLATSASDIVVLHGDFQPLNVLSATREPWLVIDPVPMVGDRTYDLVQFTLFRRGDLHEPERELRDHVERIAAHSHIDPWRLVKWCVVKLVFDVFLSWPGAGEIKHSDVSAAQQFLAVIGRP